MIKLQALHAFLSHLSKREKAILYGTVFVVSLVLLDRLIVSPIFSMIGSLGKEIHEKESNIKKNVRMLAEKDRIKAESAKYNTFLGTAGSEEEEATSILKEIETIASKDSVYLSDMKPGVTKNMGLSRKYTINLNCEAQMEDLAKFMFDIENSSKLLTIDKYEISPKSKDLSIASCSMAVSRIAVSQ